MTLEGWQVGCWRHLFPAPVLARLDAARERAGRVPKVAGPTFGWTPQPDPKHSVSVPPYREGTETESKSPPAEVAIEQLLPILLTRLREVLTPEIALAVIQIVAKMQHRVLTNGISPRA